MAIANSKNNANRFWQFKNVANNSNSTPELLLYGDIGDDDWSSVDSKQFVKDLNALGDIKALNIRINSPGGGVFAGNSIYSALRRCKAQKTIYIDGLCASIATVVAMAGDEIIMPKNALFMIHNPWTMSFGNSQDMRKTADTLDKIRNTIVSTYMTRTHLSEDEIIELMDAETWMDADEALENGFITAIDDLELQACASISTGSLKINNMSFDLSKFKNTPLDKYKDNLDKENIDNMVKENVQTNKNHFGDFINSVKEFLNAKKQVEELLQEPDVVDAVKVTIADGNESNNTEVGTETEADTTTEADAETNTDSTTTETNAETETDVDANAETEVNPDDADINISINISTEEGTEGDGTEAETETETDATDSIVGAGEKSDLADVSNSVNISEIQNALALEVSALKAQISTLTAEKNKKDELLALNKFKDENKEKFANLIGTEEEIVNGLYALHNSSLDDSTKELIFKNLEAKNESLKALTSEIGTTDGATQTAKMELDQKAEALVLASGNKISLVQARASIVEKDKALYEKIQAEKKK